MTRKTDSLTSAAQLIELEEDELNALGGRGADTLIGNIKLNKLEGLAGNDRIEGLDGNDTLDGGEGVDTMLGGEGNDLLIVDNLRDMAMGGRGIDTVIASVSHALAADVEHLELSGNGKISGFGNDLANSIFGNNSSNALYGGGGADTLDGRSGDDLLDGGSGNDSLIGGLGNDTHVVDSAGDRVFEKEGEGLDWIRTGASFSLAALGNIENLQLTGNGNISGTGNSRANILVGNAGSNSLDGASGNDSLRGGAGNDTLLGGEGNDVLAGGAGNDFIDGGAGIDIVDYSENATDLRLELSSIATGQGRDTLRSIEGILSGTGNDSLTGNGDANLLRSGDGNDTLRGLLGNDTLDGGAGADSLDGGDGTDTVDYSGSQASVRVDLGVTVQTGGHAQGDTLRGIENAIGSALRDTILGSTSNNLIEGGAGGDSLVGGNGNDTLSYAGSAEGVRVDLSKTGGHGFGDAQGDTISGFENLIGSAQRDTLLGDSLANILDGNAGDDLLDGAGGIDSLFGGAGNDTLRFDAVDRLADGGSGQDGVIIGRNINLATETATFRNIENVFLNGSALNATGNETANLLVGTNANNRLVGNDGNDTLDGAGGIDTLVGGKGNDFYILDNEKDVIEELGGPADIDTVASTARNFTLVSGLENLIYLGNPLDRARVNLAGNNLANQITGGSGADTLFGGAGNDTLIGLDGDDTLNGGTGADSLAGGRGNDYYIIDDRGDVVAADESGRDTVQTNFDKFTLSGGVENLVFSGTGPAALVGNELANSLRGGIGSDTLDGKAGSDTLSGGAGNDVYIVDSKDDFIIDDKGIDTVRTTAKEYRLPGSVERLEFIGEGNSSLVGNNSENTIIGGAGNDTLSGDGPLSALDLSQSNVSPVGQAYLQERSNFLVNGLGSPEGIENPGDFGERVLTRNDDGSSPRIDITSIFGPDGLNLYGKRIKSLFVNTNGNITFENALSTFTPRSIDAGLGTAIIAPFWADVDTRGGRPAAPTEGGNSKGTNLIYYDLDAENRVFTATWDDVGYFSSQTNRLNAFQLQIVDSGNGDAFIVFRYETLQWTTGGASGGTDGLGGEPARIGFNSGTGTIIELPQSGDERALLEIPRNQPGVGLDSGKNGVYIFEIRKGEIVNNFGAADSLVGGEGNDSLLGGGGNDTLLGGAGADNLVGGFGADSMVGGTGRDTYFVDSEDDMVVEQTADSNAFDWVIAEGSATIENSGFVEVVSLTGGANLSATGNSLANTIIGNTGSNSIDAGGGDDSLDGGAGTDQLFGGAGNDTYVIDSDQDYVFDIAGVDLVLSPVSLSLASSLVSGIENLSLTGGAASSATGNQLNNSLWGNTGNNLLDGGRGRDTLLGGNGRDTLQGGAADNAPDSLVGGLGNDVYLIDSGLDRINDEGGRDTVITSFSFSLASSLVSGSGIEDLTLSNDMPAADRNISGTGNSLANILTGNSGNNNLDGNGGADTLIGNGGNDTFNGGTGDNAIDILRGGAGNDAYIVDSEIDIISDDGGTDTILTTVSYSLAAKNLADIENLTFTGPGKATLAAHTTAVFLRSTSSLGDTLIGGQEADTLDGGGGANSLAGGDGDDFYFVNSLGDQIVEAVGRGIDTASIAVSRFALGNSSNVERLVFSGSGTASLVGSNSDNTIVGGKLSNTLRGEGGNDSIIGGDQADSLLGGAGNDTLDGRKGNDVLVGGTGNDRYIVSNQSIRVVEEPNGGTRDVVDSTVDFSLLYNQELKDVENLQLRGSGNLRGTGNTASNSLSGNDGKNTLSGGEGNDTILGGLGADLIRGDQGNDSIIGGGEPQTDIKDNASTPITLKPGQKYGGVFELDPTVPKASSKDEDWIRASLKAGQDYIFILSGEMFGDSVELANSSFGAKHARTSTDGSIDGITGVVVAEGNEIPKRFPWDSESINGLDARNSSIYIYVRLFSDGEVYIPIRSFGPATGRYTISLPLGDDPATNIIADDATNTLIGGAGKDTVVSGNGRNTEGLPIGDVLLGGLNAVAGQADTDTFEDMLIGGDGNDTLDGGANADSMLGGRGDDVYYIDDASDEALENLGEGDADRIVATLKQSGGLFDIDLAEVFKNIEHASMLGAANLSAIGNRDGNSLSGNAGNNTLDGREGDDTLLGGGGNDSLFGFEGADSLYGGSGINTLNGGKGSDTYMVDLGTDRIIGELANLDGGIDLVRTRVNFDPLQSSLVNEYFNPFLPDGSPAKNKSQSFASRDLETFYNLEDFELLGSAIYGIGNARDNEITVTSAAGAYILGQGGSDLVTGGAGSDSLFGDNNAFYATPDLYAAAPFDTRTQAFKDGIMGKDGNNTLGGNDTLLGGVGDDWLDGGDSFDSMVGGDGNDTFVVNNIRDLVNAGDGSNELFSSVNQTDVPDGISRLKLVVVKQPDDSGQKEVASFASFAESKPNYSTTNDYSIGTYSQTLRNSTQMEVLHGVSDGRWFSGSSLKQTEDSSSPSPFKTNFDLQWDTAGIANPELTIVGFVVEFQKTINGIKIPWLTYLNGKSQDFTGTVQKPSLLVRDFDKFDESGNPISYEFRVRTQEFDLPTRVLPGGSIVHQVVTLVGGSGSDMISAHKLTRPLPGGLVDDLYLNPFIRNNLSSIIFPPPINPQVDPTPHFVASLVGGEGNDLLVGSFVNGGLGVDYTLRNAQFNGLNTMVGGQGSDTFIVQNGGRAFGDTFDHVIKFGNETPVNYGTGGVGASLNGGQHNLVVSTVPFLTLSDTIVSQGKFIDRLYVDGGFGMGNRLQNHIAGFGTLVGGLSRDSLTGSGFLIGGTAYGSDNVGFAIKDFASPLDGGNGLMNSIFRDTDPVPVDPNGPAASDPSQFWFVPGFYNYGEVYDPASNRDTLVAASGSTLDGGAANDSLVGSGSNDMFFVSNGSGRPLSKSIGFGDAVFGNGGNDTVMFVDSDNLWWPGYKENDLLPQNTYRLDQDISNLILQMGSPTARNGVGNSDSTGNAGFGSNLIVGNEFDNILDGADVGNTGVDTLIGDGGLSGIQSSDHFLVDDYYRDSTENVWKPSIKTTDISAEIKKPDPLNPDPLNPDPLNPDPLNPGQEITEKWPIFKHDWDRVASDYRDFDFVVIRDFENVDRLRLSGGLSSYSIGNTPSGFGPGADVGPKGGAFSSKEFGIYYTGAFGSTTPDLVAVIQSTTNLLGTLTDANGDGVYDTNLVARPASPSSIVSGSLSPRVEGSAVPPETMGWGQFYELDSSAFSAFANQPFSQTPSTASLSALMGQIA